MGLFSSKKKVYVSSTIYSLSGDAKSRPDYLKSFIMKHVHNESESIGTTITQGYLNGPGIRYRQYGKWAREQGYGSYVNFRGSGLKSQIELDTDLVISELENLLGSDILLISAEIDYADYMYWAEEFIKEAYPYLETTDWSADYDDQLNEISVVQANGIQDIFTPDNFDIGSQYLFCKYQTFSTFLGETYSEGTFVTTIGSPSTDGYSLVSQDQTTTVEPRTITETIVIEYSDGTDSESSINTFDFEDEIVTQTTQWERELPSYQDPQNANNYIDKTQILSLVQSKRIKLVTDVDVLTEEINGVTITTTVTTTKEVFEDFYKYKIDYRLRNYSGVSQDKIFIYKRGSDNANLNILFGVESTYGTYLPFLPIRYNNRFLSSNYYNNYFTRANKAARKSIGTNLSDLISKISANGNLGDIDYGYICFGVPLNTKDPIGKLYLYEYFNSVKNRFITSSGRYINWRTKYEKAYQEWLEYTEQVNNSSRFVRFKDDLKVPDPLPAPPTITLSLKGNLNFWTQTIVQDIEEFSGSGIRNNLKVGQVSVKYLGSENFYSFQKQGLSSRLERTQAMSIAIVSLVKQVSKTEWVELRISGLKHRNIIYRGKAVEIDARTAFSDSDESGFLIPIHEGIFRALPLRHSTQLTTNCSYIVFNSYKVVKQKWYQSGWFKVVMFIIIIVISIYSGGAGAGLLGTNAAVGASLGLVGTAAIVAGAIANAVAAMIVGQLLSKAATSVFGEEFGMVVAMVASYYIGQMNSGNTMNFDFSSLFQNLFTPQNLAKLSMGIVDYYAKSVSEDTQGIVDETNELLESYATRSQEISDKYNEMFGSSVIFNPLTLTDPFKYFGSTIENSESFLNRTLLVGSDIAEISRSVVSEFANINLSTKLPAL